MALDIRWRTCPKCKTAADTKRKKAVELVSVMYGVVDEEDYLESREKANLEIDLPCNLVERYNFEHCTDGLRIIYKCHCNECGYELIHNHLVEFKTPQLGKCDE